MLKRVFLIFVLSALTLNSALAGGNDSLALKPKTHSPKKAAIMSAVLPGLGQAYNKKYWKIPIVYAGLGTLGYVFKFNNDNYQTYRKAYVYRVDSDPTTIDNYTDTYTDGDLNTLQEYYHRNRDLAVVGCFAFYVLNIVDATVDAHLFKFDVSDDLSLRIQPTTVASSNYAVPGLSLRLCYK